MRVIVVTEKPVHRILKNLEDEIPHKINIVGMEVFLDMADRVKNSILLIDKSLKDEIDEEILKKISISGNKVEFLDFDRKASYLSSEGYVIMNSNLEILDADRDFEKITGYAKKDILGRNLREIFSLSHEEIDDFIAGKVSQIELNLRVPGRKIVYRLQARRKKDRIVGSVRVVPQDFQPEKEFERYAGLLIKLPKKVGIAILKRGVIKSVNERFSEVFKKNQEFLLEKHIIHLFTGEDREKIKEVLENGGVKEIKIQVDNEEKLLLLEVVKDERNPELSAVYILDLTQYSKTVDEEKSTKDLYKEIFEAFPFPAVLIDGFEMVMWNRQAESYLNISGSSKKDFSEFICEKDWETIKRRFLTIKSGFSQEFSEDVRIISNGETREALLIGKLVYFKKKGIVLCALIDKTQEKRLNNIIKLIYKLRDTIQTFRLPEFIISNALNELRGLYNEVFIVRKKYGKYEFIFPEGNQLYEKLDRKCILEAFETQDSILKTPGMHPLDCLKFEEHKNIHTLILPLRSGHEIAGFAGIISKYEFSETEIKVLQLFCDFMGQIFYRYELEKTRKNLLEQLKRNINDFSILIDRIRNPLAVVYGHCEMIDHIESKEALATIVKERIDRINEMLKQLEKQWIESEELLKSLEKTESI